MTTYLPEVALRETVRDERDDADARLAVEELDFLAETSGTSMEAIRLILSGTGFPLRARIARWARAAAMLTLLILAFVIVGTL